MYRGTDATAYAELHFEFLTNVRYQNVVNERNVSTVGRSELDQFILQRRLSDQSSFVTMLAMGLVQLERGAFPAAEDRFSKAIEIAGTNAGIEASVAYYFRGVARSGLDRREDAASDFDRVTRFPATDGAMRHIVAAAYIARGIEHILRRDYPSGLQDMETALGQEPGNGDAMNNKAVALSHLGEHEKALALLEKVIDFPATRAAAYSNQGIVLTRLGRFPEALKAFGHAIALSSREASFYLNRAETYRRSGEAVLAIADLKRAAVLNPKDYRAVYVEGNIWSEIDQFVLALDAYSRALALKPDFADTFAQRAVVHMKIGDLESAEADLKEAERIDPNIDLPHEKWTPS